VTYYALVFVLGFFFYFFFNFLVTCPRLSRPHCQLFSPR